MRRHWLYLKYVLRHKWFVFVAGRQTKAPLWNLIIHDWTKFLPQEWRGYVDNFYPVTRPEYEYHDGTPENGNIVTRTYVGEVLDEEWDRGRDRAEAFERAWNHHQKANPHHWQYWVMFFDQPPGNAVTRYSVLPMPDQYVREMVADWMGAGRAITGKWEVGEWYAKNRYNMLIHTRTREYVNQLIEEVTGKPIPEGPPTVRGYNESGPRPNKQTVQIGEQK